MSAEQTPGAPTEKEWVEALAEAMWRREYRVAPDLAHEPVEVRDGFADDATAVLAEITPLIDREREAARAEGMAAVAGPVLALAETAIEGEVDGQRAPVPLVWAADLRAAIPADAAEALARLKAQWQAEALREAADKHEAQLVCCDIYDRLKSKPTVEWSESERREFRGHSICYWGAAAAEGDRDRAARIAREAQQDGGES